MTDGRHPDNPVPPAPGDPSHRARPASPQSLLAYLTSHPGWHSGVGLAAALGVTSRTIRNYIDSLNGDDPELIERTHQGYRLRQGEARQRPRHQQVSRRRRKTTAPPPVGDTGPVSSSSRGLQRRQYAILRRILTSDLAPSVVDLAEELRVSESTATSDLRQLQELADRRGVRIERHGDRIDVAGDEAQRRGLIRDLMLRSDAGASFIRHRTLAESFPDYDLPELRRVVVDRLTGNGLHTSDYSTNALLLDLLITLDRLSSDYGLAVGDLVSSTGDDPRSRTAADQIAGYLRTAYGVHFSPAERDSLTILIASKTTLLRGATDQDVVIDHVGDDTVSLVRDILKRMAGTYLVSLNDDAFTISIALHTHNLLQRVHAGRPLLNPLANSIRHSHPLVYELAVFFASELEHATSVTIPAEEIGFIAVHLGSAMARHLDSPSKVTLTVVAPRYHGLAQQIAGRLQLHLEDRATIVQTLETAEPELSQLEGQLVISSVPIPGLHPTRYVPIGHLLTPEDLYLVDSLVRARSRENTWLRIAGRLHDLFHPDSYFRNPATTDRDETLRLLCDSIGRRGIVHDAEAFLTEVLERESFVPTVFNDIVAIPHTLGMTANRTGIAVGAFENPIDWAGSPVRLVLLIAFSVTDRSLFRDIFDQLVIVLSEPRNVRQLVTHGFTVDDFIEQLCLLMTHN